MATGAARVQVTGAKELRAALRRAGADVKDMTRINKSVAEIVAADARQKAPARSGRLRKSIRAGGRQSAGYVSAGRSRTVPYAGPIHYGWPARNIESQPFLLDAMGAKEGEVIRQYQDHIADLVIRVGRETP
jgi:hypothetical protein